MPSSHLPFNSLSLTPFGHYVYPSVCLFLCLSTCQIDNRNNKKPRTSTVHRSHSVPEQNNGRLISAFHHVCGRIRQLSVKIKYVIVYCSRTRKEKPQSHQTKWPKQKLISSGMTRVKVFRICQYHLFRSSYFGIEDNKHTNESILFA